MVASTYRHPERISIIKAQPHNQVLMLSNLPPAIGLEKARYQGWGADARWGFPN
jgi:hypothetical protein